MLRNVPQNTPALHFFRNQVRVGDRVLVATASFLWSKRNILHEESGVIEVMFFLAYKSVRDRPLSVLLDAG